MRFIVLIWDNFVFLDTRRGEEEVVFSCWLYNIGR